MIRRHPIVWSLLLFIICPAGALIIPFQRLSLIPEVEYISMARLQISGDASPQTAEAMEVNPLDVVSDWLTDPSMLGRGWERYVATEGGEPVAGSGSVMPEIRCKPARIPGVLDIFATGSHATVTQRFLNALLDEFVVQLQGIRAEGEDENAFTRALAGQISVRERASWAHKFRRPSTPSASAILTYGGAGLGLAGLIIALAVLYFEMRT